ncbi:hypothetical protein [uncultured Pseudodesulfovibrio sp.]|uniref:hypothetical protein n=1 Tax=uncultured Pseudodesulfovibrio sp. TaxID=2035858 RepID=UPI0029C6C290|nr:hypothetical protein [uncultured Pseudodesulfovibrio sp.]
MRMNNQHLPAEAAATPMPFGGLGFAAAGVRHAALEMTPAVHRHHGEPIVFSAGCGPAVQLGGYRLLVALGREIRGR